MATLLLLTLRNVTCCIFYVVFCFLVPFFVFCFYVPSFFVFMSRVGTPDFPGRPSAYFPLPQLKLELPNQTAHWHDSHCHNVCQKTRCSFSTTPCISASSVLCRPGTRDSDPEILPPTSPLIRSKPSWQNSLTSNHK